VLTFSAITSDTNAAGGTVATATLQTSADVVCVHCAVSTSGSDINLSSLAVGAGDTVSVSSLTYTASA
jgi:dTDP-4-amino-4,6-dideoxygalactose transaminase